MSQDEAGSIFFHWQCRNGENPESVSVYGSWDEFTQPIPLKFNKNSMFGGDIKIKRKKGTFYYYYDIDGERRTDHTKAVITNESEEYNFIQLPLESAEKETCQLFQQLMDSHLSTFPGHHKRTIEDLSKFDEEIEEMFVKWDSSKGLDRALTKGKIRLKLLNEIGCLPNLSMEENIVEFRRNIAVLRIKLKQIQMQNEKRIALLNDEKQKATNNLQEIWKKEREKWRNIMQQLRTENQALRNGESAKDQMDPSTSKLIHKFTDGKDLKSKDDVIFSQKQKIELLEFEIAELKKKQQQKQSNNNQTTSNMDTIMMKKTIVELSESFNALKIDYNLLDQMVKSQKSQYDEQINKTTERTLSIVEDYNTNLLNMTNKYKEAMQLKRKYFNQVQELRGNIRVYARCRPILPIDGDNQQSIIKFLDDDTLEITNDDKAPQLFTFDKVFDTNSTQEMVYKNVSPLIESVMDGYNCCIFAYGQTGSGKTFTMQGDTNNPGLNIRALQHLFTIAECRKPDFEYNINVSMIEIYNEKIRDLLVKEQKIYKIRQKNKIGGNYIENLSIHNVKTEHDVFKLMNMGMKYRSVACTNSNEASSRSHMVLTISVTGKNSVAKLTYMGKLNLIDLAGSERVKKSGVDGTALKEAQNINKSLSSLGDVISALSKKSRHIPFRNSTLTHMLADSLGGNSKCLMFTNLSPAQNHYGETINALKFGKRAKNVELGPTKKSIMYHGHQSLAPKLMDENKNASNRRDTDEISNAHLSNLSMSSRRRKRAETRGPILATKTPSSKRRARSKSRIRSTKSDTFRF